MMIETDEVRGWLSRTNSKLLPAFERWLEQKGKIRCYVRFTDATGKLVSELRWIPEGFSTLSHLEQMRTLSDRIPLCLRDIIVVRDDRDFPLDVYEAIFQTPNLYK